VIEIAHRLGSRLRHCALLERQAWLWGRLEPTWERAFRRLTRRRGYPTVVNGDAMRLEYACAARYDRAGRGEYEPVFYRAFTSRIAQGMTVLDVGAHVGIFSLGAALRVGRGGRVYAFEPSPAAAEILRRHVRFAGWEERILVSEAVVSDVDGVVPFFTFEGSMAASLSRSNVEDLNPEEPRGRTRRIESASVTLDRFCELEGIEPAVLKVDVEGAELRVLKGAARILRERSVAVFCEIHPRHLENCGSSLAELEAFLGSVGYGLTRLEEEPHPMGIFHGLIARGR
jgi:FkbM family methyltransferase